MEENIKKMKSFETLIYSDQTLKVTLTPDRLVTIETHKPLPKLAPREPVTRESLITKSLPKPPGVEEEIEEEEEDVEFLGKRPQKENLYEFLKNSGPEDYNIKNKVSQKGDISSRRRGKPFDKLDTVSEISRSPGSPRHTPLIPSAKSTPSLGSPYTPASPYQPSSLSTNSSLHHSKSLEYTSSRNIGSPIIKQKKPNLYNYSDDESDDDFDVNGKRNRRPTQDLIDFLKTTPPSDKTTFPDSLKDSNYNNTNGKKMEAKIRKIFSILKIKSLSDDSNYSSSGNNLNTASSLTTSSASSTSTATFVTKQRARFIKIEIPPLPPLPPLPPKDNYEQPGFIGVQGKNTHQLPKAKSTSNLPHTQNKTNPSGSSNSLTKVTATLDSKNPDDNSGKYNESQVSNSFAKTVVSNNNNNNNNNNINVNTSSSKEMPRVSSLSSPSSSSSPKKLPTPSKTTNIINNPNNQNTTTITTTNSTPVITSIKTDKSQTLTPKEKALPPNIQKNSQEKQQQQILRKSSSSSSPPPPQQQQQQQQKPPHQSHQSHQPQSLQSKSKSIQNSLNKKEPLIINKSQENTSEVFAPSTNDKESIKSSKITQTNGTIIPIVENNNNNNNNNKDDKMNEKVIDGKAIDEKVIDEKITDEKVIDGKVTSVETQVQETNGEIFVINLTKEEESEEGIVVEWLLGTCLTYKSVRDLVIQNEEKGNNDVLFVESREINYIDNVITGNNFVQVGHKLINV